MIEAYKMILKEGGSVRRAEALARIFKSKLEKPTATQNSSKAKIVNELIAEMANSLQSSLGKNTSVKMRRSRVETAIQIVLKGTPEETESQLEKIYKSLSNKTSKPTKVKETPKPAPKVTPEPAVEPKPVKAAPIPEPVKPPEPVKAPEYSNPFEPLTAEDTPKVADDKAEFPDY